MGGCRGTVFPSTSQVSERHRTLGHGCRLCDSFAAVCSWPLSNRVPATAVRSWGPFCFSAIVPRCKTGVRQLAPLAPLDFTSSVNNKLSDSNRGSIFLYQLNPSVLDLDFPLGLVPFIII